MRVLVYHRRAEEYRRLLHARFPGLEVIAGFEADTLRASIPHAEVLLAWRFPIEALPHAARLRWIQLTSAGAEHLLSATDVLREVVVTNTRGLHAELIADYALGVIVMLHWNFPGLFRNQQARAWRHQFTAPLAGRTLGIIGVGAIGREIARRGSSFGMTVVGVRRDPAPVDGVSRMFGPDRLREMLPACDFVVLVVPETRETRRMIGETELRAMKRTAYLVNVARGSVVDEAALITALREGWIAGAALDVFETEPLPPAHPFWTMDNVVVTPHIAGEADQYVERVMEIFGENLTRWQAGQPLRNVVDLARGY